MGSVLLSIEQKEAIKEQILAVINKTAEGYNGEYGMEIREQQDIANIALASIVCIVSGENDIREVL